MGVQGGLRGRKFRLKAEGQDLAWQREAFVPESTRQTGAEAGGAGPRRAPEQHRVHCVHRVQGLAQQVL